MTSTEVYLIDILWSPRPLVLAKWIGAFNIFLFFSKASWYKLLITTLIVYTIKMSSVQHNYHVLALGSRKVVPCSVNDLEWLFLLSKFRKCLAPSLWLFSSIHKKNFLAALITMTLVHQHLYAEVYSLR